MKRMDLNEHKAPTGPQGRRDGVHPGREVFDPGDRADRRVRQIEAPVEVGGNAGSVGLHPRGFDA
jgi:hypothetical protein